MLWCWMGSDALPLHDAVLVGVGHCQKLQRVLHGILPTPQKLCRQQPRIDKMFAKSFTACKTMEETMMGQSG